MKDKIILALKGAILGVANIIPGVSGGTLAITLGIYEELINIISHILSNLKKNITFLIPLVIGAGISIVSMSKIITYSLDNFTVATTMFFIGLIIGGIPLIYKKVSNNKLNIKNIFICLLTFSLVLALTFINGGGSSNDLASVNVGTVVMLFLVGVVAAATMIIPGISGSFVLMLLGYYEPITKTISSLTNFDLLIHNFSILCPFGFGVLIGIVLVAKLIEYLLNKHEIITYYAILGFIISSIIGLVNNLSGVTTNIIEIIVGAILFIIGSIIGYKLGDE